MATRKKRAEVEWVGGLVTLPTYVTGEGAPFQPEMLLWLRTDGLVLGHEVGRPGEVLSSACESLRRTIESPMVGGAHTPDRVRVASPALAEVLRAGWPAIDVVCEATPEIDMTFSKMRDSLAETERPTYLTPGLDADAMAALFRAAARLYRAKPWKVVPNDQCLFSIRIDGLGVHDAVLSIVGQLGESLGFLLFSSAADFDDFLAAAEAIQRGESMNVPPHLALNFDRGADLDDTLRKEIATHGWEVAEAKAYPWVVAIDENVLGRPPTPTELATVEAVALALPEVLREKAALRSAWEGGERVERTVVVAAHTGDFEVMVRAPGGDDVDLPDDLLAALVELDGRDAPIDPDARRPLEAALVRKFVASPEAEALEDARSCELLMDLAGDYFDVSIATLEAEDLREIVFDILPAVVDVDATLAAGIVEEIRAFYSFLGRKLGLEQADACLRVIGGDAVERLERALSDATKFSDAKTRLRQSRGAGFARAVKEGLAESRLPPPTTPAPQAKAAKSAKKRVHEPTRKAPGKKR
ncbi:MAG: hypothetical protein IPK71_08980 [Myxococcales bacterium]|nr:hypothetical protein [Myxococcales bacterium]